MFVSVSSLITTWFEACSSLWLFDGEVFRYHKWNVFTSHLTIFDILSVCVLLSPPFVQSSLRLVCRAISHVFGFRCNYAKRHVQFHCATTSRYHVNYLSLLFFLFPTFCLQMIQPIVVNAPDILCIEVFPTNLHWWTFSSDKIHSILI